MEAMGEATPWELEPEGYSIFGGQLSGRFEWTFWDQENLVLLCT